MLVSFSVTNFRSIKDKQTISLEVATKYHKIMKESETAEGMENNFFHTEQKTAPDLLASAAIYGANASGKTSLVQAIYFFNAVFMCFDKAKSGSDTKGLKRSRGDLIKDESHGSFYRPFLFDVNSSNKPTEFEIDFISNKTRYVYSFSYDLERIHSEKLEFYRKEGKKNLLYELKWNEKNELEKKFSENFKGKKERALDIIQNTNNNLFLNLNINEDGNKFLNPVYDWISEKLFIEYDYGSTGYSAEWIAKDSKNKNNALELVKKIDPSISDLSVEIIEISESELPKFIAEDADIPDLLKLSLRRKIVLKFKTIHGVDLARSQISSGTLSVFSLSSILFPILLEGGILFFDELDTSLHPDALVYIIKMFHDPRINIGKGQIIFTAHNDILLEKEYKVLRRDQVWFTSKEKKSGVTELYSLSDFPNPTKRRDNIAERYRNYAYGARPILKKFCHEKYV